MPPKRSAARTAAVRASGCLEYRAPSDDAWYSVRLELEGKGPLRVMYYEFQEAYDERFEPDRFGRFEEVEEFRGRFRRTSVQMQDWECRMVIEGMEVCASHSFGERDLRYYDAVVDAVSYSTHPLGEGKDVCSCMFVVLWQQGPLAGERTSTGIEDICRIQPKDSVIDPLLEQFLDMAWKNIAARHGLESVRCDLDSSIFKGSTSSSANLGSCSLEEMTNSKAIVCKRRKLGQDTDLGSSKKEWNYPTESYFVFRIGNLEKDVSPFCVMDFIQAQTSLSSQAVICPGFSLECYSTGTILVETKEKADKLSEFLYNPGHIIMSSRGKPWVISESWCGSVEGVMPFYEQQSRNKNKEHTSKIKLVHMGSKEYEKGEQVLKIHKEFHDHAQLLQRRLAKLERDLVQ